MGELFSAHYQTGEDPQAGLVELVVGRHAVSVNGGVSCTGLVVGAGLLNRPKAQVSIGTFGDFDYFGHHYSQIVQHHAS